MKSCKHEDDKCEYWYMGLCELDDRLNVCPHDELYKQLQKFGGHISNPVSKPVDQCLKCDAKMKGSGRNG